MLALLATWRLGGDLKAQNEALQGLAIVPLLLAQAKGLSRHKDPLGRFKISHRLKESQCFIGSQIERTMLVA